MKNQVWLTMLTAGLSVLGLCWHEFVVAQETSPPPVAWNRIFDITTFDDITRVNFVIEGAWGADVLPTATGGFIVVGYRATPLGNIDALLIRTDYSGEIRQSRTFGALGDDYGHRILPDASGGFRVLGRTTSVGREPVATWLLKTDANLKSQWIRRRGISLLAGQAEVYGYALSATSDGDYVVGGRTDSTGTGDYDGFVVRMDEDGTSIWEQTLGGSKADRIHSIAQTTDSGFIIAGVTQSYGARAEDMWLVKTDPFGFVQWNGIFGGNKNERAFSVIQTHDGGYVAAGFTGSYSNGGRDAWLIKTDGSGNLQWRQSFGGKFDDVFLSLRQTRDDGFILAGWTESLGAGGRDGWLVRTDSQGVMLWQRSFGGSGQDRFESVRLTREGGYIVAGNSASSITGMPSVWLVKIAPE